MSDDEAIITVTAKDAFIIAAQLRPLALALERIAESQGITPATRAFFLQSSSTCDLHADRLYEAFLGEGGLIEINSFHAQS